MELQLLISTDKKDPLELNFKVNDTILINFSRDIKIEEYCFVFESSNYSSLSFTFVSNLKVDCYFVFFNKSGKPKFTGCHTLQKDEITLDIKECEKFLVVIPRSKNNEVCAALTLASLSAQ